MAEPILGDRSPSASFWFLFWTLYWLVSMFLSLYFSCTSRDLVLSHFNDYKCLVGNWGMTVLLGTLTCFSFIAAKNVQLSNWDGQKEALSTFFLSPWLKVLCMQTLGTLNKFCTSLSGNIWWRACLLIEAFPTTYPNDLTGQVDGDTEEFETPLPHQCHAQLSTPLPIT